jgi:hypothetical protein
MMDNIGHKPGCIFNIESGSCTCGWISGMDRGEREKLVKKRSKEYQLETRLRAIEERLELLFEKVQLTPAPLDPYTLLEEWLELHFDPCFYDHHGYCQSHFLQDKGSCIVELTRKFLEERTDEGR